MKEFSEFIIYVYSVKKGGTRPGGLFFDWSLQLFT